MIKSSILVRCIAQVAGGGSQAFAESGKAGNIEVKYLLFVQFWDNFCVRCRGLIL